MNSMEAQVRWEVALIVPIVEGLAGLPLWWNGHLELVPHAEFRGEALMDVLARQEALAAQSAPALVGQAA